MVEAMKIEIISIGDELLTGHIINTNAAWLANQLLQVGWRVAWMTVVGDEVDQIVEALHQANRRAEVVLVTGGLGPTHDDVTRTAVCRFFQTSLVFNAEMMENIKAFFNRRGIPMAAINEDQARVPEKARLIANDSGTAPGYILEHENSTFYFLPGVPHEMRSMMERVVLSELCRKQPPRLVRTHYLCTIGIAESTLYEKIGSLTKIDPQVRVAFLPGFSGVKIRLMVMGEEERQVVDSLTKTADYLREKISEYIYAEEDVPLERALARHLTEQQYTLSVAESCTGGLIANKFTDIAGSSKFFERGIVAYSNQAKTQILGVPQSLIATHGAVSEQVAGAMAEGVRKLSQTDFGLATTGIAGPTGDENKPVGLVFVACADAEGVVVEKHTFIGDRYANKQRFAYAALNLLRKRLFKAGIK